MPDGRITSVLVIAQTVNKSPSWFQVLQGLEHGDRPGLSSVAALHVHCLEAQPPQPQWLSM